MEHLKENELGQHESWREYAEHSLTHDDLPAESSPIAYDLNQTVSFNPTQSANDRATRNPVVRG